MYLVPLAFLAEAIIGYPPLLFRAIKHPVVWMGTLIAFLDKNCNQPNKPDKLRRGLGVLCLLLVLAVGGLAGVLITNFTHPAVQIVCMASLFASRSLYQHVQAVYAALKQTDLPLSRNNLSKIVGRDVENLDESEISKAAIESLAESFCDGVVAPALFAAFFGLTGLVAYKMVSTADSMIGHKTKEYQEFGWAAARLDDVFNYIPARLSALIIAAASHRFFQRSLLCAAKDGKKHASPNSGYPEAAMAGALGVRLGGERSYDGEIHHAPVIGESFSHSPTPDNLGQALNIYIKSCVILWLILLVLAILL